MIVSYFNNHDNSKSLSTIQLICTKCASSSKGMVKFVLGTDMLQIHICDTWDLDASINVEVAHQIGQVVFLLDIKVLLSQVYTT